eukprot:scpid26386/ scgid13815/ Integrator complex subunit 5
MLTDLEAVACFSPEQNSPAEVVHHATAVLFGLPSLRQAALAQLAVSIGKAVTAELKPEHTDRDAQAELVASIQAACETILKQLDSNMSTWAGILFEWSLCVLGEVSYNHPGSNDGTGNMVSDRIAHWRSCSPTAPVLDVAVRSVSQRMKQDPVACVHDLVMAVRALSPHLDWMLALAAGMFSSSLVPALLRSGLRDFHAELPASSSSSTGGGHDLRVLQPARGSNSRSVSPVMSLANDSVSTAVIQILTYLLGQHASEVRSAMVDFFKASLIPSPGREEQQMLTVPYLLHLASECPQLLHLVLSDVIACLSPDVVKVMYEQYITRSTKWPQLKEEENIHSLLKQLRSSLEPTLLFLFQLVTPNELVVDILPPVAQQALYQFLEHFIANLQYSVTKQIAWRGSSSTGDDIPAILLTLRSADQFLLKRVLPEDPSMRSCTLSYHLLRLTGLCAGETWCANLLASILLMPPSHRNHSLFVDLHKHFSCIFMLVLDTCLERLFAHGSFVASPTGASAVPASSDKRALAMMNLNELCQHETEKTFAPRCSMNLAQLLSTHAVRLCNLIQSSSSSRSSADPAASRLSSACLAILQQLPSLCAIPPSQPSMADSVACARAIVSCYGRLCTSEQHGRQQPCSSSGESSDCAQSMSQQSHAYRQVMARLARHHIGMQPFLQRLLIEASATIECVSASSSQRKYSSRETHAAASNSENGNRVSLLDASYRHCSTAALAPGAGAAASVKAKLTDRRSRHSTDSNQSQRSDDAAEFSSDYVRAIDHFTHALTVVCDVSSPSSATANSTPLPSGLPSLASILFEMVSEESGVLVQMTGSALWPEEDFLKYTQRSDMTVLRCFESHRLMWQALSLLQNDPAAYMTVCPLVRSLLATQLIFWQRWKQLKMAECMQELRITCDTLSTLAKANWVPKQLLHGASILPLISPADVHSIVSATWTYLRATWDSRQAADQSSTVAHLKTLTATLTGIAADNMDKVGHFYHLLS